MKLIARTLLKHKGEECLNLYMVCHRIDLSMLK